MPSATSSSSRSSSIWSSSSSSKLSAISALIRFKLLWLSCIMAIVRVVWPHRNEHVRQQCDSEDFAPAKARRKVGRRSAMGENILFRPADQVEASTGRQEAEARVGDLRPVLPGQSACQNFAQPVQVKHVGGGVVEL